MTTPTGRGRSHSHQWLASKQGRVVTESMIAAWHEVKRFRKAGMTHAEVADALTAAGLSNFNGEPFSVSSVSRMANNPVPELTTHELRTRSRAQSADVIRRSRIAALARSDGGLLAPSKDQLAALAADATARFLAEGGEIDKADKPGWADGGIPVAHWQ